MSFLNRIFGGKQAAPAPVEAPVDEKHSVPLPDVHTGMLLNVVHAEEERILLVGKVASYSSVGMTLECPIDVTELAVLEKDTPVRVRGHSSDMKSVNYRATIRESLKRSCRIGYLEPITYAETRQNCRLHVSVDCRMFEVGKVQLEDTLSTLVNISTGGACVSSPSPYAVGDKVQIFVQLPEELSELSFKGKVVRVIERSPTNYECGIQFDERSEAEQAELNGAIFKVQAQMRRERLGNEDYY